MESAAVFNVSAGAESLVKDLMTVPAASRNWSVTVDTGAALKK